jgi:predicted DNA binding CopG/RHH family protein
VYDTVSCKYRIPYITMAMSGHKTTIMIPEDLHRRVKAKAALQGTTITAVLKELLERWVEEDPPAPRKEDR